MRNLTKLLLISFLSALMLTTSLPSSWAQNIVIDSPKTSEELTLDDNSSDEKTIAIHDPLQKYNRWMFGINDKIYRRIFNPISHGYERVVPKKAQKSLHNVNQLIRTPIRFVNNLLQRKYKAASIEVERLVINATCGVVGLSDCAQRRFHISAPPAQGLSQTLGSYGVGAGSYIVLPILGPSDPRNIVGLIGDMALNPLTWASLKDARPEEAYTAYQILNYMNHYSYNVRNTYTQITEGAVDEYIAVRQVYLQNRENKFE